MADVDGAKLYYEVRGRGPALLMISGAGGDAGYYAEAAAIIEDSFTVITYDRRGNSRSTGRNDAPISITEQARDAKALIDEFADGRAVVFGNSAGAIIGLALAAAFPAVVAGLIAHEPPILDVLPDDAEDRDFFTQMRIRGGLTRCGHPDREHDRACSPKLDGSMTETHTLRGCL